MDCPNCGVYNPEDRMVCWRCDQELPKPKKPKKRGTDPDMLRRRMWLIVGIVIVVWVVITWLLPVLLGGGGTLVP
jgi:predicted nucleic acid-binding Zn ribbon protein